MTREDVLAAVAACPLIASVQSSEGSSIEHPETLLRLALASRDEGVRILRLQGVENIRTIRAGAGLPTIGLIKRQYEGSDVYITATSHEVDEVLSSGAEVVALDGTARPRPGGEALADLITRIRARGALALADIDTAENAEAAVAAGADFVSTTLAGYTVERHGTPGPDLELLREITFRVNTPVFAEGRYARRWEAEAALRIGAAGVIVGGALNDPVKLTKAMLPYGGTLAGGLGSGSEPVGAVDIGGTWLRFALFSGNWKLGDVQRTPNPPTRDERLGWIRERIQESGVKRVGVSTGGIVDPASGVVWKAKEYLMHDQIGIEFSERTLGVTTHAFGDGHATAWAHANLPQFAGRSVFTLALGTGVGAGFAYQGRLWAGPRGEYPRINDLYGPSVGGVGGQTYEDLLGGIHLTKQPTDEQIAHAVTAFESAIQAIRNLYFPDDVVVGGGVGMSAWLAPHLAGLGVISSPIGPDAGLYGAAALTLYPSYV
jgi:putative N-acetylmannosamine-6-phosphate epimerase/predicted NBD/HSP70 family sugar kinase